ncbi:MAG TPA: cupin domain-containing protein [Dehalococcoidia bacterium]|nr:cupin domain-containing protein [Dehalococcoidia bacterium]
MDQAARWNAFEVVKNSPLQSGHGFQYNWLGHARQSSVNIVQVQPAPGLIHIHREHDEVVYMLEADTEFRLGEETIKVKPGDIIHIPAGTPHGPVKGEKLALVSIYSPLFDPENPDREYVQ